MVHNNGKILRRISDQHSPAFALEEDWAERTRGNVDETNRRRPSRSGGSHVFLTERRLPVDPNPVWIPTNPKTLGLCGRTAASRFPLSPPSSPLFSQVTVTDVGSKSRHLYPEIREFEVATQPKMTPTTPKIRQKALKKGDEERRRRRGSQLRDAAATDWRE